MSCTSPMKGFADGYTENNKIHYKITNYNVDYILKTYDKIPKYYYQTGKPEYIDTSRYKVLTEWIEIPCGKCESCRMNYARQWADRCMLEAQQHEENCFITLTYDDDHLPYNFFTDDNGVIEGVSPTLVKRHVQLFIKQLRNYINRNVDDRHIKYFVAGEYGEKNHRPHYHLLLFGWKPNDLLPYKQNFQGDWLYISPTLNMLWKANDYVYNNVKLTDGVPEFLGNYDDEGNCQPVKEDGLPRGFVTVGDCNWNTCAYTARYILKKQYGDNTDSDRYNFLPEYTSMSLRPAIGREFFDENNSKIFDYTHFSIATPDGGKQIFPSRYYERLFEEFDPNAYIDYKQRKQMTIESKKLLKGGQTSLSYLDSLKVEADVVHERITKLKRSV